MLFGVIAAVNLNSINSPFQFDDLGNIKENRGLTSLSNLRYVFAKKEYFELFAERTYRPITTILNLFLKKALKDNPAYWRLFNLLLHWVNCCVLYLVFRRCSLSPKLSLLAVTLFAVHTVHTEIVNVISFNEDLLGGFFCLLAFYCYLGGGALRMVVSLGLYFLSCLVKEAFIVLPALCLIFSLYEKESKLKWPALITSQLGYLVMAILFLFINFRLMSNPNAFTSPIYPGGTLFSALLTFAVALLYYLKIFFLPLGLSPTYNFITYHSFTDPPVILALTSLSVIFGLIIYGFYRRERFSPFLCWFYLFLLPTSNIIPYGGIQAERYLYFPLMGLIPGVLLLARLLLEKIDGVKILPVLGLVFLLILSVLTVRRNAVWQDPITLWQDTLTKAPNNAIPLLNLAYYYKNQNDTEKAVVYYKLAIKADPMQPLPYRSLGMIYWGKKMYRESRENFEIAIQRKKGFSEVDDYYLTLIDLGAVCLKSRDYQAALKYWLLARKDRPYYPTAYYNLALVYRKLGRKKEAEQATLRYLELAR